MVTGGWVAVVVVGDLVVVVTAVWLITANSVKCGTQTVMVPFAITGGCAGSFGTGSHWPVAVLKKLTTYGGVLVAGSKAKVTGIEGLNTAPVGPSWHGMETILSPAGAAGAPVGNGDAVTALSGLPFKVPDVPEGIFTVTLLSEDLSTTASLKVPVEDTAPVKLTVPVPVTVVVTGGVVDVVVVPVDVDVVVVDVVVDDVEVVVDVVDELGGGGGGGSGDGGAVAGMLRKLTVIVWLALTPVNV